MKVLGGKATRAARWIAALLLLAAAAGGVWWFTQRDGDAGAPTVWKTERVTRGRWRTPSRAPVPWRRSGR